MYIECVRCEKEFDTDREATFSLASTWRCSFCGKDNSGIRNKNKVNNNERQSEVITNTATYKTKNYKKDDKKVYIMRFDHMVKVGISNYPKQRLEQFKTSNPKISLEFVFETRYGRGVEDRVHRAFDEFEVRNEWFEVSTGMAISKIVTNENPTSQLRDRVI